MADPPTPDADESDPVAAVLVEILESRRPGAPVDPAVWYARYPEFRTELEQFFADQAALTEARDQVQESPAPTFPGYTISRELGRGGNGVVFEATELATGRVVALKALVGAHILTPVERVRFRREIKAASILDHPAVLPVLDAGEVDGTPFYTMMLAVGGPLSKSLERYTPDPKAAAALVARLARGVHFAHQRGILHRDLKPSNILLDGAGAGYVSDFGLVRDLADPDPLTRTRELVGTIPYMAPESTVSRGACTVAVDVYGLGCILYACLTGRPPIEGASDADTLLRVRTDAPPPPARLNPQVPRDLDAVCRKCLEKEPGRRYSSAAELADDLDRFGRGAPVRAKPVGPMQRAWRWVKRNPAPTALRAVAALVVVAATGLGIWNWDRQRLQHRIELRTAENERDRQRFFAGLERVRQRRSERYNGWTRDTLADVRELAGRSAAREFLPELRSEAATALGATDILPGPLVSDFPAYASHFSADRRWFAVAGSQADRVGRVELTDRTTDIRETLAFPVDTAWQSRMGSKPDGARSVRFSPDNRWLVVGTRSGWLVRWDMRDRTATPLAWPAHTADQEEPRFVAVHTVGFTADSHILLSGCEGMVRGWTVADGRPTRLALKGFELPRDFYPIRENVTVSSVDQDGCRIVDVAAQGLVPDRKVEGAWVDCLGPTEDLMAYKPSALVRVALRHAHPLGQPRPIERWEDRTGPTQMTFSRAGHLLAAVYEHDLMLRVWDVPSGNLVAEVVTDGECPRAMFDPDGRHLVVSSTRGARRYDLPVSVLETVAVVAEPRVYSMCAPSDHSEVIVGTWFAHPIPPKRYRFPLGNADSAYPVGQPLGMVIASGWADSAPDGQNYVHTGEFRTRRLEDQSRAQMEVPGLSDLRFGLDSRLWILEGHRVRVGSVANGVPAVWQNDAASEAAGADFKCLAPGRTFTLIGRRDGRVFQLSPTGVLQTSWKALESAVVSVALSPDEDRAVVGGERGEVRLIEVATGAVADIPNAHRLAVSTVAYGPNFFATGSTDRRVRLWTPAGVPIATLQMSGAVQKILVSGRGDSLLVQVDGERAVRRWKLDELFRAWADLGLGVPDHP